MTVLTASEASALRAHALASLEEPLELLWTYDWTLETEAMIHYHEPFQEEAFEPFDSLMCYIWFYMDDVCYNASMDINVDTIDAIGDAVWEEIAGQLVFNVLLRAGFRQVS